MNPQKTLPILLCSLLVNSLGALNQQWAYTTGGLVFSSPAMAADGTVYIGSRDNALHALSPDGQLRWTFPTGDWVDSTPTVSDDGTIYFGSWDNCLYALDPDGNELWRYETGSAIISAPLLLQDKVVVGSIDGFCYALDASTGAFAWAYLVDAEVESPPIATPEGTIYLGARDNTVHALDLDTGQALWVTDLSSLNVGFPRPTNQDRLVAGLALASDGLILCPSGDGLLYALDSSDGALAWVFDATAEIDSQPVVDAQGHIYFGCRDGLLYCIDVDGFYRWSALVGQVYYAAPALGRDNAVYIVGDDPANNGSLLYRFDTSGGFLDGLAFSAPNDASPLLTPDGYLYLAFFDGKLVQLNPEDPPAEGPWPLYRQGPRNLAHHDTYYRPFHQWVVDCLGQDALLDLDHLDDADGDGIGLLGEFVMGMNPTLADAPTLMTQWQEDALQHEVWANVTALDVVIRGQSATTLEDLGTSSTVPTEGEIHHGFQHLNFSAPLGPHRSSHARWHFELY